MNFANKKITLFTAILLLMACGRKESPVKYSKLTKSNSSFIQKGEALSFQTLKQKILDKSCIECHSGENAKPKNDPIDFTSYESMMNADYSAPLLIKGRAEDSRLFHVVERDEMPTVGKKLSDLEKKYLFDWINACAPIEETKKIPESCTSSNTQNNNVNNSDVNAPWSDEFDIDSDIF